jgi:hypothetical protein
MEFFSQTFFARKGKGPKVYVTEDLEDPNYPITIHVSKGPYYWNDSVIIHFESESDYLIFKNSAISAHEAILRSRNKNAKKGLDK